MDMDYGRFDLTRFSSLDFFHRIELPQYITTIGSPARGRGESPKLKKNQLITACLSPAPDDSKLFKDLIKNRQTKIWIQTYKNSFSINFKKVK